MAHLFFQLSEVLAEDKLEHIYGGDAGDAENSVRPSEVDRQEQSRDPEDHIGESSVHIHPDERLEVIQMGRVRNCVVRTQKPFHLEVAEERQTEQAKL